MLAISLSACAPVTGTLGGTDIHSAQYRHGYQEGREARLRYGTRPDATAQDLAAYCDEAAYLAIQPMKGDLVLWSEGFNAGCHSPLRELG